MIYSTELASKIVITDSNKNSKFLEAGIHDNVKFTGARAATSPTGKNFMELRFEKDGKELLHTEWEPSIKPEETEEQSQSKITNQVTRIMRVLKCFYPKELINFNGNSYKEFSDWAIAMLNAANKNILLKLKVTYNEKGYTTLPSYVSYAVIEPMDIPEGFYDKETNPENKSMITKLSIDMFTKPVTADKETKVDELSVGNDPADDLPF